MKAYRGFSLIELLVVISIIALLIAILLPALARARHVAYAMQSMNSQRSIGQTMFVYAQDNNSYYPGLSSRGEVLTGDQVNAQLHPDMNPVNLAGSHPSARMAILVAQDMLPAEMARSPLETLDGGPWVQGRFTGTEVEGGPHYSYALLALRHGNLLDHRLAEWQATSNGAAILLGDRALGNATQRVYSIQVRTPQTDGDHWEGALLRGDMSVAQHRRWQNHSTQYGNHASTPHDDLFHEDNGPTTLVWAHYTSLWDGTFNTWPYR